MTIGQKIKYLRTQMGITQNALASLAGVHPVTIRKYETDKMKPQAAQLSKLADALQVSVNALMESNFNSFQLKTHGDLMSIIIVLYRSKVITINGLRGEDGFITAETISIQMNPIFSYLFDVVNDSSHFDLDNILFSIKNPIIRSSLQKLEKIYFISDHEHSILASDSSEEQKATVEDIDQIKEKVELELQRDMMQL